MVGVQDLWLEHPGGVGHHLRSHCVGEVHRQEAIVDGLQILHLRDVLRVPGDIDPFVAEGNDIPVPDPFRMIGRTGGAHVDEVISRHRLDPDAIDGRLLPVLQDDSPREFGCAERGQDHLGSALADLLDRVKIEMVPMLMGREDQIGLRQS